jgi:hypothetical protein
MKISLADMQLIDVRCFHHHNYNRPIGKVWGFGVVNRHVNANKIKNCTNERISVNSFDGLLSCSSVKRIMEEHLSHGVRAVSQASNGSIDPLVAHSLVKMVGNSLRVSAHKLAIKSPAIGRGQVNDVTSC